MPTYMYHILSKLRWNKNEGKEAAEVIKTQPSFSFLFPFFIFSPFLSMCPFRYCLMYLSQALKMIWFVAKYVLELLILTSPFQMLGFQAYAIFPSTAQASWRQGRSFLGSRELF